MPCLRRLVAGGLHKLCAESLKDRLHWAYAAGTNGATPHVMHILWHGRSLNPMAGNCQTIWEILQAG